MNRIIVTAVICFLAGIFSASLFSNETAGTADGASAPSNNDQSATANSSGLEPSILSQLREQIENERQARLALAKQLQSLQQQFRNFSSKNQGTSAAEIAHGGGDDAVNSNLQAAENTTAQSDQQRVSLSEFGFSQDKIAQIQQLEDKQELSRLYLRDQAIREGWMGTEKYNKKIKELENNKDTVRNSLSEEEYDRYLYANGRANRVTIHRVMNGSAAEKAGLQSGDRIISYADQRIFSWQDLRSASTEGYAGNSVRVDVERMGQPMTIYLPRGPLGVQLGAETVKPQ